MRLLCLLLLVPLLFAGTAPLADAADASGVRLEAELTLQAGSERVRCLAWSPDGRRLAAGSFDRTLRIWDPGTAEPIASLELPRYG